MDTARKFAHTFIKNAYGRDATPRIRRTEHFHLGWGFDAAVIVAFLIAVVGYLTA